jgi:hypothetical protein
VKWEASHARPSGQLLFPSNANVSRGDEHNLVHSERFRVYKMPIWAVKTEIVGIAPALELQHKANCCPVKEYGGVP